MSKHNYSINSHVVELRVLWPLSVLLDFRLSAVKRNKTRGTSRLSEEDSRTFGEKYNDNTTRCGLSPVNGEHHIGSDAMAIECGECFSRRTIKGIQTQFGQLSRICSLGGDMWYRNLSRNLPFYLYTRTLHPSTRIKKWAPKKWEHHHVL